MRKYLCLFTLALCAAGEPPTSIRGVVLDPSGRPIEGARVQCALSVFTNIDGLFSLSSDPCDATIEKQGFVTQSAHLIPGEDVRLTLEIAGPVESVLVSATGAQATPEQAAVAANVVTGAQLEARDFISIPDMLRELPDMQISDSGRRGGETSIFTRGSSSTSTLVLLDGVPLNDPGGQINLANLTSTGIDRIEAVRGPESVLFGAEAADGVVQLFTKRGDPEATVPHGYVSYERGNFQTDRWLAGLNGGLFDRLDYSLAADYTHNAGEFPNDFYRNNTGSANIGYRISDATQIRGIFRVYDGHVGTPGQVAYNAIDSFANEQTRDDSISARVDDSRGSKYFQTLSFSYHRLHDLFNENEPYSQQNLAALLRDVPDGSFPATYLVTLLNPNNLPTQIPPGTRISLATAYFGPYGSLNITERKIGDYQGTLAQTGGALVFGYDYQDQSGLISGTNASRDHNGIFVNEQYSFGSRLYVSAGARFEHSSAFGSEFIPRAGLGYRLLGEHGGSNSTYLRLSAGRGISEPSLYENYIQSPYAVGNPALKPEKTNSYEAALVEEWWHRRVRSEVAAFRSSFTDLITFVGESWENIEASWARGVEFSSEAKLPWNLSVSGNYTRLYTRVVSSVDPVDSDTGVGQTLLRRAPNSGSTSITYAPKKLTLVAGARIVGERHDSDFLFGINRNPAYQNVFFSASYTLSKHFTPVLRIDNLLNENYQEVLGYTALSRTVIGGLRIGW
jgi:outer membrane cobalamin receptor